MAENVYSVVPRPVVLKPLPGRFLVDEETSIVAEEGTEKVALGLANRLRVVTGFDLPRASAAGNNSIWLRLHPEDHSLGTEGYRVQVGSDQIQITAAKPAGLFYGAQTLLQLLPADILRRSVVARKEWPVPAVHIEDKPRFSWRGSHLDVCRHFMPKEFVLKFIDLLAFHKLNVFHFHLTEDQGWRIEIKKYPKLTEVGGFRKCTENEALGERPHGGFYTQEDIKEIVAYAKERFVTVVPEIELPGHARAALAAYPELGEGGPHEVATLWGVFEEVYNTEDATILFLKDVFDEVLELFPSHFIHVGGDECPKTQWKNSPSAQAKMKAEGLKDEEELQSWFIGHFDRYLVSKGRRLVGWDEILEGGLAPGATVMSWRGEEGGIAAAKAGHDVVMTPGSHTYLDHYQSEDQTLERKAIGGFTSLEKAYSYEPVPAELTAEEAKHVLGAQGQLWTEYMPNPKHVEYMAYPRLCALSEVFWLPKDQKNYAEFATRMEDHLKRLDVLDVNYRPLNGPKGW